MEGIFLVSEQYRDFYFIDLFCCLLQCKGNEDGETVIVEKDHFMDDFFQQVFFVIFMYSSLYILHFSVIFAISLILKVSHLMGTSYHIFLASINIMFLFHTM